jgi:hypothetical protein
MAAAVLSLVANPSTSQSDRRIAAGADRNQQSSVRHPDQVRAEVLRTGFGACHFENNLFQIFSHCQMTMDNLGEYMRIQTALKNRGR